MAKYKFIAFLLPLILVSCHKYQLTTMHLKKDEYLLKKNVIELEGGKEIDEDNLGLYIRQKPNSSWLFGLWKMGLQWKNIWYKEGKDKPRPAVVLDTSLVERSKKQIEIYLQNLGYYNSNIETEIKRTRILGVKKWETKKAVVTYHVRTGEAYKIDSLGYYFPDTLLEQLYKMSHQATYIKQGKNLRVEDLQLERERIAKEYQNHGFYDFAENYIYFDVDTTRGAHKTAVITKVKKPVNEINTHYSYAIRNIFIQTDYEAESSSHTARDTIEYAPHVFFISNGKSKFKPTPIYKSIFLKPGEDYSVGKYNASYKQLLNLQMFSLIDVDFVKVASTSKTGKFKQLDMEIKLSPAEKMAVSVEATGTFREGFGANGQITFSNKNPFGGAEIFEFRISGGLENLKSSTGEGKILGANVGPRLSMQFPSLLFFPKLSKSVARNAFPKTTISASYNFQKRVDFTRYLSNIYLKYLWHEGKYKKHEVNILDFSFSYITEDSKILSELSSLSLSERSRFKDNISSGIKYRFTFNNQLKPGKKHPVYLIAQGSLIGFSSVLTKIMGVEKRNFENAISLFGIRYSNYFKADVDYRYYHHLDKDNILVGRVYSGAALPIDKDGAIPFEQLYFAGGANSIRGWQQRTVGPGQYFDAANFFDRLGEIKLEGNVEYRFPVTQIFKGAVFVDAGNVWNIRNENSKSNFAVDKFYQQLAVSSGLGLRLDFDFFLFRVDAAYPLKEPYKSGLSPYKTSDINWNFGIGYPF